MTLKIFLALGTILMLAVMLYLRKYYNIVLWKTAISSVLLTFSGLIGARFMFWIETGNSGGVSYFGAVFFAPLIMIFVALMLKIPFGEMLDMCAPSECIMLALLKVKCLKDGCCGGKLLYATRTMAIRFPSQIIEMLSALCILFILIWIIHRGIKRNQIYACYMIIYGVVRFVLNLFRDTKPFIWILPAGNFWALVSIGIGTIWLIALRQRKTKGI